MIRPTVLLPLLTAVGDVVAAGITWLGWTETGHSGWKAALAVLVVASPLGLIVAQHLPARLARRAGRGLTVTHLGAGVIDAMPRLNRLVIDSHGTVTTGHLVVTEVQALDPEHDRNLRWFAGALSHSSHDPVSRAIARLAGTGRTTGFAEEPELGICGSVDRHPVRVGSTDWLGMDARNGTGTTVGVEVDHRPMGHITVADEVRPDAGHHLAELRSIGINPVLVSSAAERDLARVAELSGAEEWYADTDTLTVVELLDAARSSTGWVTVRRPSPDADGPTQSGPVEVELVLPGANGEDASISIRTEDPSVSTVMRTLGVARRARRARRVAARVAWLTIVVLLPLAAAGLLHPGWAAALALAALAVVALAVALTISAQDSSSPAGPGAPGSR